MTDEDRVSEKNEELRINLDILNNFIFQIGLFQENSELLKFIPEYIINNLHCKECSVYFTENDNGSINVLKKAFYDNKKHSGFDAEQVIISKDNTFCPLSRIYFSDNGTCCTEADNTFQILAKIECGNEIYGIISAISSDLYPINEYLLGAISKNAAIVFERNTQLDLFSRVSTEITSSKNQTQEDILKKISLGAYNLVRADSGFIVFITNENNRKEHKVVSLNEYSKDKYLTPRFDNGVGITHDIYENGNTRFVSDITLDDEINQDTYNKLGFRSLAALPFKIDDEVIGVLYLLHKSHNYTPYEKKLMEVWTSQGAIAIKKEKHLSNQINGLNALAVICEYAANRFMHRIKANLTTATNIIRELDEKLYDPKLLSKIHEILEIYNTIKTEYQEIIPLINNDIKDKNNNLSFINLIEFCTNLIIDVQADDIFINARTTINIEFINKSRPVEFYTNRKIFRGAVLNIINNAIESMEKDGTIAVALTSDTEYAYIEIKDEGCGIAKDKQDQIWEFGYSTKDSAGIGLGYSALVFNVFDVKYQLVKSERHRGTTIALTIPIKS
jgi:signal transduction histidine kinase